MNFIIQQSRSFEGVCVPLRLTSCLFPVLDSQPTATELFQSSPFGSGTLPDPQHVTSAPSLRLLHSLEDILRTALFIKLLSCLQSDIVILDTLIVFIYLLTYLLTWHIIHTLTNYKTDCQMNYTKLIVNSKGYWFNYHKNNV